MRLGYARVSTDAQDPALQIDALRTSGTDQIWTDQASGRDQDRPQLTALLEHARDGDVLVVWRLDRLGRSVRHLVSLLDELDGRGIQFQSLTEGLDTTTPGGRLIFHVFSALAEFEADLIRSRTLAGLQAARDRGHVGGRPRSLSPALVQTADRLRAQGQPVTEIARELSVSRATIYRALADQCTG